MAAGIINDSKTVLKKLTIYGLPRPGFDNRYVIWHPDDADKKIVDIKHVVLGIATRRRNHA